MTSPYYISRLKYEKLKNTIFTCEPNLSLDDFDRTPFLGKSAS